MRYPRFYEMYRQAVRNTWTVEEVDFSTDLDDLRLRIGPGERHLIERLVAFFATGDSIVANNLVLNLYRHINAPEARLVPVAATVRGGAARPVLPHPARRLSARSQGATAGLRGGGAYPPSAAKRSSASAGSIRSMSSRPCARRRIGAVSCST